jgi:hypothetical protein
VAQRSALRDRREQHRLDHLPRRALRRGRPPVRRRSSTRRSPRSNNPHSVPAFAGRSIGCNRRAPTGRPSRFQGVRAP